MLKPTIKFIQRISFKLAINLPETTSALIFNAIMAVSFVARTYNKKKQVNMIIVQ